MKLITFDFWNTLFLDRDEDIRSQRRISHALETLSAYKSNLTRDQVEAAFQIANQDFERQWKEYRASTMDRFVQNILSTLDLKIPVDEEAGLVEFFETVLLEYPPVLISGAEEAIRHASSKMRIGLICDTGYSPGSTLRRILNQHDLLSCFHAFSFSNETGYLKPSSQCFLKILDDLQIKPEESVHIGDLEYTDIKGAKEIGMKAIKYIGSNPAAIPESIADAVIPDLTELPRVIERLM